MDIHAWLQHQQPRPSLSSHHHQRQSRQILGTAHPIFQPPPQQHASMNCHRETLAQRNDYSMAQRRTEEEFDTAVVRETPEAKHFRTADLRFAIPHEHISPITRAPRSPRAHLAATAGTKRRDLVLEPQMSQPSRDRRVIEPLWPNTNKGRAARQPPLMTKAVANEDPFQRKPRRKTRDAIYEFGAGVRRRQKATGSSYMQKPSEKKAGAGLSARQTKHRVGTGLRLVNDFEASNVAPGRLTMDRQRSLGFLGKGKASSPIGGTKDSSFAELEFLRKRKHQHAQQHDRPPAHSIFDRPRPYTKKRRRLSESSDQAIAAYFSEKREALQDLDMNQTTLSDNLPEQRGDYVVPDANADDDMLDQGPCDQQLQSETLVTSNQDWGLVAAAPSPSRCNILCTTSKAHLRHPSPERLQPSIGARMHAQAALISYELPDPRGLFEFEPRTVSPIKRTGKDFLQNNGGESRGTPLGHGGTVYQRGHHHYSAWTDSTRKGIQPAPDGNGQSFSARRGDEDTMTSMWSDYILPSGNSNDEEDEEEQEEDSYRYDQGVGENHLNQQLSILHAEQRQAGTGPRPNYQIRYRS